MKAIFTLEVECDDSRRMFNEKLKITDVLQQLVQKRKEYLGSPKFTLSVHTDETTQPKAVPPGVSPSP
jgi:hypothetical protein